jgi:hypothetical protein
MATPEGVDEVNRSGLDGSLRNANCAVSVKALYASHFFEPRVLPLQDACNKQYLTVNELFPRLDLALIFLPLICILLAAPLWQPGAFCPQHDVPLPIWHKNGGGVGEHTLTYISIMRRLTTVEISWIAFISGGRKYSQYWRRFFSSSRRHSLSFLMPEYDSMRRILASWAALALAAGSIKGFTFCMIAEIISARRFSKFARLSPSTLFHCNSSSSNRA